MELCALIISILAFCLSLFQFVRDSSRQKKEATLNAYNQLQEDVFSEMNQYADDLSQIEFRSDDWNKITVCMAKIEIFSIGINTNIYSFKILNRLGGGFFVRQFDKLKPIIDIKRGMNISKGKHYDEFEKTANRLKKYRSTTCILKKFWLCLFWSINS